jgi:hypothetical protein
VSQEQQRMDALFSSFTWVAPQTPQNSNRQP